MSNRNTYISHIVTTKKAFIGIGLAVLLLFSFMAVRQVSAASDAESSKDHLVTVYDGEFEKTFISTKNSVAAALKAEGIALEEADRVEPAADTELVAGSYSINVYRARPVTIIDGDKQMSVLTSAQNPKQVVKEADATLYEEDETDYVQSLDPLSDGGTGLKLVIDRATPFEMTLYGKKTIARSQAATVGEMLAEKDIELGPKDGMSVKSDQELVKGMKISIWRNGKQTITEEQVVKKSIEEIQDADRKIGYRSVKTPGKDGTKDVTYEIELRNGKEVSRKKISSNVTKQPVKEVVVVGTKSNYSGSVGEWLSTLRGCEAGGNYKTNTGNGYYGAYQFSAPTWNSLNTGYARADLAPPAVQDQAIIDNTNRSGSGLASQNPGCYSKHGLSAFPPN